MRAINFIAFGLMALSAVGALATAAACIVLWVWDQIKRRQHDRQLRRRARQWDWDLQQLDGQQASPERGVIYIDSLKGHVGRTEK